MSTAMNCTVKTYQGVPLVKGGTEVLYLSQGSAEGALSAYLHKTYTQYYYTREQENYIQVEDVIQNLEGCNYVSFQNASHGGKLFFGFIDHLEYVNDNNTGIVFTIDPFPTYLGDCGVRLNPFTLRNTDETDSDYSNNEEDFDFYGKGVQFETVSHNVFSLAKSITMFTCDTTFSGTGNVTIQGFPTGIQYFENASVAQIQQVIEAGGQVLGCYAVDANFTVTGALGSVDISPSLNFQGTHAKLKGGQYNKISVVAGGTAKQYDLMKFTNKPTISFRSKRLFNPAPCIAVYPLNYEGVAENTAEAIIVPYPSIAMNYQDNFSIGTAISNFGSILKTIATRESTANAMSDASALTDFKFVKPNQNPISFSFGNNKMKQDAMGFAGGLNTLLNSAGILGNVMKSAMPTAGINTTAGNLVLNSQNQIIIDVVHAHHYDSDIALLDSYFDYYGYSVNARPIPGINTLDKAFLQVGEDIFYGSEKDEELNSMARRGIKIRRQLP